MNFKLESELFPDYVSDMLVENIIRLNWHLGFTPSALYGMYSR